MKKVLFPIALSGLLFFSSCSNEPKKSESESTQMPDSTTMVEDSATKKSKEILDFKFFYKIATLPSPMEMINAIYQNDVPFNKEMLNSPSNEEKYNTAYKKAINYGVYGIDMAYAAFYGQNQDLLEYYSTTRKLSEKLNVQETFDTFTQRFRENADNKDSLVSMIDRAYSETDAYLRSNHRLEVAAHVLAGSIMEVQYLSIELMKNQDQTKANAGIFEKIYNQKLYLENLISLFDELKKYQSSKNLQDQLITLKKSFDAVKSPADLTKPTMAGLSAAVTKVRAEMIQ